MALQNTLAHRFPKNSLQSGVVIALLLLAPLARSDETKTTGTLKVTISGLKSKRGQVVAKLFVKGNDVPRGKSFRKAATKVQDARPSISFSNLAHGQYALFLFHDENENGIPDHNLFGFPKEPLGFSNGFRVSLLSGIPDFDDLKFHFGERKNTVDIPMK